MSAHSIIITVLAVALLGYCGKLQFAEGDARAEAERIVAALEAHKGRAGIYPASLDEVGFDAKALRDKWYLSYRLEDGGKPALFYSAQNMWLVAYHYDFELRNWKSLD